MPGSSLGEVFRVTTFGESHGPAIGVVIDGCPAGLTLSDDDIDSELSRRRPGQSDVTTSRQEQDRCEILSGVFAGETTGAPIAITVRNHDAKPSDYDQLRDVYRPSHADFTYHRKFGVRDHRGGGRASARETVARVAAGAVAYKFLSTRLGVSIVSYSAQIGDICAEIRTDDVSRGVVDASLVRCPDAKASERMVRLIHSLKSRGDSIGGIIGCVIRGLPIGLGEPVFDKFHADLGKAMLSINAVKGFEIGLGFGGVILPASQYNDPFVSDGAGGARPASNRAGGVLGGITSGEHVECRIAFKPPSTITTPQVTMSTAGDPVEIEAQGRHDPCVLPRAVPIVDAMAAIVVMDHYLRYTVGLKMPKD